MSSATLTGSPGTIVLGERTYLVGQPTPEDMGTIGAYLQRFAKSPVAALEEDPDFGLLPPDEQAALRLERAREKFKSGVPYDGASALAALTGLEGTRFLAWVLIRKHDALVTLEKMRELITEENYLRVSVELDVASGMANLGNRGGRPGSGDGASPTSANGSSS